MGRKPVEQENTWALKWQGRRIYVKYISSVNNLAQYIQRLLQLQSQSIKTKEEPYIRVNTRELNGVPATKCLPYIHLANGPCYTNCQNSEQWTWFYFLFLIFLYFILLFFILDLDKGMMWCHMWQRYNTYHSHKIMWHRE